MFSHVLPLKNRTRKASRVQLPLHHLAAAAPPGRHRDHGAGLL